MAVKTLPLPCVFPLIWRPMHCRCTAVALCISTAIATKALRSLAVVQLPFAPAEAGHGQGDNNVVIWAPTADAVKTSASLPMSPQNFRACALSSCTAPLQR